MNLLRARIPTIVGLLVLVGGIVAGIYVVNSRRTAVDVSSYEPKVVRITNISDSKFSVSWMTDTAVAGKVMYGKVGDEIDIQAVDDRDSLASESSQYVTHHVTMSGLQPSTQYAFKILTGERETEFDNNGSAYVVATGPVITSTPPADAMYGEIQQSSSLPAEGAVVYATIPGGTPVSTLVKASGNWTIPMSIARTTDLASYVVYDPSATVISIVAESGKQQATATTNTANVAPVPLIVMGQSYDFRSRAADDEVEVTDDVLPTPEASPAGIDAETDSKIPGIFNIEPLGEVPGELDLIELINPAEDGEILATTRPEFRGTGPSGTVLTITVESESSYTDTVSVEDDGTWSWSPPEDLSPGEHTVTVAYLDSEGIERIIQRGFVVYADEGLPAFESTPSASVSPSAAPTPSPSATPDSSLLESASATPSSTPRVSMPSTESGVPVAGIFGPTLLTAIFGFVIMVTGLLLLVL